MRERIAELERHDVPVLTVVANEGFWLAGLPGARMPHPVLADSTATVSATYGVAFQQETWAGWSNRSAVFVVDKAGIIRYAGREVDDRSPRNLDVERSLLDFVRDLQEERALITALRVDRRAQLRRAAALALRPVGGETRSAVRTLTRALRDDDLEVRPGAAAALHWIAPVAGAAAPRLTMALHDANPSVVRLAALTLGRIGPPASPAAADLVRLLRSEDRRLRPAVVLALQQLGPAGGAAVVGAAKSSDVLLRAAAVAALPRFLVGSEKSARLLIDALLDAQPAVREAAAAAIARVQLPENMRDPVARALIWSLQEWSRPLARWEAPVAVGWHTTGLFPSFRTGAHAYVPVTSGVPSVSSGPSPNRT